jgi:hypothetical protein
MATDPRLLLLDEADNVLVACTDLEAGTELLIDGERVRLIAPVPTGHKLARRAIGAGEKVVKYAAPIGSARTTIAAGDYVHTHNLTSDYIPTFDRTGREAS